MAGFAVTIGGALLFLGILSQWLIKKRVQNKNMRQHLSWVAWGCALMGGIAVGTSWAETAGVTSAGAAVAAAAGLLWIAVDLVDRRPDWPAFFLIIVVPGLMKMTGGPIGTFFDLILAIPTQAVFAFGRMFGF